MIKAEYRDKPFIVHILADAFDDNKSVNYIVKQDTFRRRRIHRLMDYAFELCFRFGAVYLSPDKGACALIIYPDMKKFTLATVLLDVKLALFSIGIAGIKKALSREVKIKQYHPSEPFSYLWFIGVEPAGQNRGIGTLLLQHVVKESLAQHRSIYLETSSERNLHFYEATGFQVYHQLDFGFPLYLLKRESL